MITDMNLKYYEGKKVNLTTIYNSHYYATFTEYDSKNELVTIKNEGFQEITFAIEEIKNIEMKTEKLITEKYLQSNLKNGFSLLNKFKESDMVFCLVGIDQ